MERPPPPARRSHTSTADLLTWTEASLEPAVPSATPPRRPHQPSEAISKVVFGGQVTEEEAENLNKRKPCSAPKWKEMTGSGIFVAQNEDEDIEPDNANSSRNYQAISTISHISFAEDEDVSPKKPISAAEVAKQRELSGTLQSESESKLQKQLSNAKSKELSGHDIFAPPEDPSKVAGRSGQQNGEMDHHLPSKNCNASSFSFGDESDASIKTAKKIPTKKFEDLTGKNIFTGDSDPTSADKPLSEAKLKEMTGSNIFADGKAATRDYLGGVRKPPGGESSIALV